MLLLFILGLLIGSFLNVVALRLPQNEPFWRGRSHCVFCKKILRWFELVPVLSFLWQGGKCRICQKSISLRYILVEIATGGLFAGAYYFLAGHNLLYFWPILIFYLIVISILEVIFLIDLKDGVIPDVLIWPVIILILFFWYFLGGNWLNYFLTGLGWVVFFGAQYLFSKGRWIGAGDIGLGFLLGVFLGFPLVLAALFFAYIIGALIGLFLIIFKKKKWANAVPFGPFLVLGTLLALFWGNLTINWYLNLIGGF